MSEGLESLSTCPIIVCRPEPEGYFLVVLLPHTTIRKAFLLMFVA